MTENLNNEVWKVIPGFNNKYEVSNMGRVKSLMYKTPRILKSGTSIAGNPNGYQKVMLRKNNKTHRLYVHILVAEAFLPNPENKPEVNHIDEVKTHNWATNLEWVTRKENINHGTCIARAAETRKNNKKAAQNS